MYLPRCTPPLLPYPIKSLIPIRFTIPRAWSRFVLEGWNGSVDWRFSPRSNKGTLPHVLLCIAANGCPTFFARNLRCPLQDRMGYSFMGPVQHLARPREEGRLMLLLEGVDPVIRSHVFARFPFLFARLVHARHRSCPCHVHVMSGQSLLRYHVSAEAKRR